MSVTTAAFPNVSTLTEREKARLVDRTRRSGEYFERAHRVMPGGVPSSFQRNDPWPTYIERGRGAQVWDVDGNEYLDFHNGFGVMCVGHANPTSRGVKARWTRATTSPPRPRARSRSPRSCAAAGASPSGASPTPAPRSTMDAVHLARGFTGAT
jgi:glutamate-1-semialdehyde 2,1-aminomutase